MNASEVREAPMRQPRRRWAFLPARVLPAAAAAMLLACSGEPRVVRPAASPSTVAAPVLAWVVSHGWHTGIVIPAGELNARIPDLADRFGTPAFYEIGWGDEGFYQAQDITTGLALRALFWSPGTVIHVSAVPVSPLASFASSEVLPICISRPGLEALQQFLSDSFVHDESGHLVALSKGIYGDSQFYEAAGRYSVANTCNTWTAKGLSSAGLDIDPALRLTAGSVMRWLREARTGDACAAPLPA